MSVFVGRMSRWSLSKVLSSSRVVDKPSVFTLNILSPSISPTFTVFRNLPISRFDEPDLNFDEVLKKAQEETSKVFGLLSTEIEVKYQTGYLHSLFKNFSKCRDLAGSIVLVKKEGRMCFCGSPEAPFFLYDILITRSNRTTKRGAPGVGRRIPGHKSPKPATPHAP